MTNIYDQTLHRWSGILVEFLSTLFVVLPTVAATCKCYLVQHVATLPEDGEIAVSLSPVDEVGKKEGNVSF
ncbi:hypothetical protein HD806DRAFT_388165 [Xylariaceae sp. AK1471]|nr:hypothetical protein HD806DRAFT_388165 [Xylariaceae sp. AK1471]